MKCVLGGPPRSGKSCLREGLKAAVRAIPGAPYCYVITACPDGEGAWFQGAMHNNPEQAKAFKARYKKPFSDAFVERTAASVRQCNAPLTLVDIGGIPDAANERICAGATHAILLAGDPARLAEWREFCGRVGLAVVAEIHSDYYGQADVLLPPEGGILRGSVHCLERGEPVAERPVIRALARLLVDLAVGGPAA
jgi:CRISPR-associated protein Csx3